MKFGRIGRLDQKKIIFGSDPEHTVDITDNISLPVSQQLIMIQDAPKFLVRLLLSLSFSDCE